MTRPGTIAILLLCGFLVGSARALDSWEYNAIDTGRTDGNAFGLAARDLTGDGYMDIVAGGYFYRNPGPSGGAWHRVDLGKKDALMALDIDGDDRGISLPSIPAVVTGLKQRIAMVRHGQKRSSAMCLPMTMI